jgi:hypothetical protein
MMIGDELEYQIEILEDTENAVDATRRRLDGASRRLRDVHERAQTSGYGNMIIAGLVVLLIVIVVFSKWIR